jgi:hypothetical protein
MHLGIARLPHALLLSEAQKANCASCDVSEACLAFDEAVLMRGHFELGTQGGHTHNWRFTPTHAGALAIVLPVFEQRKLVDFLAIDRKCNRVWGCCTGAGQFVGSLSDAGRKDRTSPLALHVHDTARSWILADCQGILPLAKAFFPLMQLASNIVARDYDHAWQIAKQTFIYPAERFGLDCEAAEREAFARISFDEAAA